ncbi:MAG: LysR family transcriptional regulator, partial [Myxococcota bacterium]
MAEPPPRLDLIWNWLPPFRAVAETEHLPTAAKQLNVTASALSRSVRLLEDALGQQLFHRVGRTIVLNAAGRRLLEAMATCNRTLDATLGELIRPGLTGRVRIASVGVLTSSYVLPAILRLATEHVDLIPSLENHLASSANERLARGALDVAFYYDALQHPDLCIEPIGSSYNSVYCGVGHPLFERADVDENTVLSMPFCVPQLGDHQLPMDGWPVDIPREIGFQITLLTTNL